MSEKQIIPVFFATDDNYVPFLLVSLTSIKENASSAYKYKIHILHRGLSSESVDALNKLSDDSFEVLYNDVQNSLTTFASKLFVRDYYSKATYYRIFIPSVFPEYDKALYLDCDIAVQGDISKLYEAELGDNYVGAVPDEAVSNVPEFIHYVEDFLDIKYTNYFNAGILVINLKQLREDNFDKKFMGLIEKYKFVVAQDQDYLNVLCKDKVTYLSKVWNKQPMPDPNLTTKDLNIIHYNLSFKPWKYDDILYEEVFWDYAEKANVTAKILEIKKAFTPDLQDNDKQGGENLIKLAELRSKDENSFKLLVERKVINLDKLYD